MKTAKGSAGCMYIPVFIYVCNVFFPCQVTIASMNTWFQKFNWHVLINNNSIFLGFKRSLMLKTNISLNETSWTMQNMSNVCGADYFHAPVIFSVPLTPKIILLHWNMSFNPVKFQPYRLICTDIPYFVILHHFVSTMWRHKSSNLHKSKSWITLRCYLQ